MKQPQLEIFKIDTEASPNKYVLVEEGVSAGFPSPAQDFRDPRISLDKELIKHPEATFFARVSGDSMEGAGLHNGDLLIIDKSLPAENNKIAVCMLEGEFTVKRLKIEEGCIYLMPENKKYKPIKVTGEQELVIWGIVTYVIKEV